MGMMQDFERDELAQDWEGWRCTTGHCTQELYGALRRAPGQDLWLLYERPGWVIAAAQPVCPCCGMTLEKAT
jgi:hypothetical protein